MEMNCKEVTNERGNIHEGFNLSEMSEQSKTTVLSFLPSVVKEAMIKHGGYLAGGFLRVFFDKTLDLTPCEHAEWEEFVKEKKETTSIAATHEEKQQFIHSKREGHLYEMFKKGMDIDVFFDSMEQARNFMEEMFENDEAGYHTSPRSFTGKFSNGITIQGIFGWSAKSAIDVIKSFDFTISQACLYYNKDKAKFEMIADQAFFWDAKNRVLRYTSPDREELPAGSFQRAQKYLRYGYTIDSINMSKVMMRSLRGVTISGGLSMEDQLRLNLEDAKHNQY